MTKRSLVSTILGLAIGLSAFEYASADQEPGLVTSEQSGLPSQLWNEESAGKMARLIEGTQSARWPVINRLYMIVDLSQSEPALREDASEVLGAARLNYLWSNGALDAAEALANLYDWYLPTIRSQVETIALLSTRPDRYCDGLLAEEYSEIQNGMTVYCLTRADRYDDAVAEFERIRPNLDPDRDALLMRFLDLDEDDPLRDEPWIELPQPFEFVLDESIGRPRGLKHLPPAYAYFSRESGVTPRSDLEITEELVHLGALPTQVLIAAYQTNDAAESGGAWGRAQAWQELNRLSADSSEADIFQALTTAWDRFTQNQMEQIFAKDAGEKLSIFTPENFENPALQQLYVRTAVLGDWSKMAWQDLIPREDATLMLGFLLRHPELNVKPNQIFANSPLARIIKPAFFGDPIDPLEARSFGEAIWQSLYVVDHYQEHPEFQVSGAFQSLRISGLDEEARDIAVTLLFDENSP